MKLTMLSCLTVLLSTSTVWSQPLVQVQAEDTLQIAQNYRIYEPERGDDDPDLDDDESLEQLMQIEFEKDAWSAGTAIGLSLVPGGGFGLIYTQKKPQAVIPFLLSTVGYGLGIAYMAGAFDENQVGVCIHETEGRVPNAVCGYADIPDDPAFPDRIDNATPDERDPAGRPYWQTTADYTTSTSGRNYSGRRAGISIIAATYIITSTLGAVWSGMSVRAHNKQLRRDIESTAGRDNRSAPDRNLSEFSPQLELGGGRSSIGFSVSF